VFDACHLGVVLRAVPCVELVVAVSALFGADTLADWFRRLSLATSAALPAVLVWPLAACSLKTVLAAAVGVAAGIGRGAWALAGLYGCSLLWLARPTRAPAWLASSCRRGLACGPAGGRTWSGARAARPRPAPAARLSELQARIRPHFLFNTLNSAIALVRAEPARAEALLEDLSEPVPLRLAEPGEAVPLAQEIALAQRYLAIEQVRFGPRLQLRWQLDPAAEGARLPPCCCNPAGKRRARTAWSPVPRAR
jgi:two-component system sensor histidine kinase AlgZ